MNFFKSTEQHRLQEPLPLTPLRPIPQARCTYRQIRGQGGSLDTREVLQAVEPTANQRVYVLDHVIAKQPTGVVLYAATPMISKSRLLVSCGPQVVVKVVPKYDGKAKGVASNPLSECAAMQILMEHKPYHPNVISLIDCMTDQNFVYLILPYLKGGDLFAAVEAGSKGLPEAEACYYLHQIADGLLFLKHHGIAHRDISLENVMFTSSGTVKVIDMGMSVRVPRATVEGSNDPSQGEAPCYFKPQRCCGKPDYLAPETMAGHPWNPFAVDIWSLGIVFYIMLTGQPLYNSPYDQAFATMAEGGVRDVIDMYERHGVRELSPGARSLICRMLDADPAKRPTLEEILHAPLIKKSAGGDMFSHTISKTFKKAFQLADVWGAFNKAAGLKHLLPSQ